MINGCGDQIILKVPSVYILAHKNPSPSFYDDDDDIYIMMKCLSVTFLLIFVSRNGIKSVLPFLDTFGSRYNKKCALKQEKR